MIKILALSDIHGRYERFLACDLPEADLVIIAGDITKTGLRDTGDFLASQCWLTQIVDRYPVTLWLAGNHDLQMPPDVYYPLGEEGPHRLHCIQDQRFEYAGEGGRLSFYGVSMSTAYNRPDLASEWTHTTTRWVVERAAYDMPPVDVVVSHSPPYGILDFAGRDTQGEAVYIGSRALGHYIDLHEPQLVICGHAHGNIGSHVIQGRDRNTRIFNVAETFRTIEVKERN